MVVAVVVVVVVVECCCFLIKIIVGTPEPLTAHSAADFLRVFSKVSVPSIQNDETHNPPTCCCSVFSDNFCAQAWRFMHVGVATFVYNPHFWKVLL